MSAEVSNWGSFKNTSEFKILTKFKMQEKLKRKAAANNCLPIIYWLIN